MRCLPETFAMCSYFGVLKNIQVRENEEYTTFFPPHTLSCRLLDRYVSTSVRLVSAHAVA